MQNNTKNIINFVDVVSKYLTLFKDDKNNLKLLLEQLEKNQALNTRTNFVGHITASAFILDHEKRKILLIKHKALGKLLQPGGHFEQADINPLNTALREVFEEVGVDTSILRLYEVLPGQPVIPIDIDTHFIPANPKKNEPSHFHHDFRYCFWLDQDIQSLKLQTEEINGYEWVDITELSETSSFKNIVSKVRELVLKTKPLRFFEEVISKNITSTDKLNSIIVTHIVQDRPVLLNALNKQTNLVGVIAKPNSINTQVLKEIKSKYNLLDFSKESLKDFNEFNKFLKTIEGKIVLLDIGGYFAPIINQLANENPGKIVGVVEDTENGHQKYENLTNLLVPVISVARSILKENEDSLVGQSIVFSTDSVLREFNRLLNFMECGIIGYGKIGKSIALNLQKMNLKPMVFDKVPSKRIKSINDCNNSPEKNYLLENADIIFCATGSKSLNIHDFRLLKNGCFIVSVTSADDEFDFDFLKSEYKVEQVHSYVTKYTNIANYFYILNNGNAINFIHGAVVGDFIFLVQSEILSGVSYLQDNPDLKPQIYELPLNQKEDLSRIWLKYFSR